MASSRLWTKKKPTKEDLGGLQSRDERDDTSRQQPSGSPTHERHHQVEAWAVTRVGWAKEWIIAGVMLRREGRGVKREKFPIVWANACTRQSAYTGSFF